MHPWLVGRVSVRMRLALAAVVAIGAVLVTAGVVAVRLQSAELTTSAETVARQQLAGLRSTVGTGSTSSLGAGAAVAGGEASLVQLVDRSGTVLAGTSGVGPRPLVPLPPASGVASRTVRGVGGESDPYVVVSQRLDAGRYLVVARSLESVAESRASTTRILVVGIPLVLLLVGGIGYWLAGRALRPVERMRAAVADYSATDLALRVPVAGSQDEISRLATTLNDMLERLERSAVQQQQFVADASHELRSPVAGLRTLLEVARATDGTDWAAVAEEALGEVERIQALTSDLLVLARSENARMPFVELDLSTVLEEALTGTRTVPVASRRESVGVVVTGNREALLRLLRNLLDNAERHARSAMVVSTRVTGRTVRIEVADDGDGIPVADRERVFERFVRLDESRARDAGGSGLGLAIARHIAVQHGGSLVVDEREGSDGAALVLTLPLS